MSDAYKHLAAILKIAQGRIDKETGDAIHVGAEVAALRQCFDKLRADLAAADEMLCPWCQPEGHDPAKGQSNE